MVDQVELPDGYCMDIGVDGPLAMKFEKSSLVVEVFMHASGASTPVKTRIISARCVRNAGERIEVLDGQGHPDLRARSPNIHFSDHAVN